MAQFAGPEDFCAINVRTVENPFIVDAEIVFIVADHDEMLAGFGLEFLQNERSAYITGAGPVERIALFVNGGRDRAGKKQNDGTASERLAPRKARSSHGSQMTQGLDEERENETCSGRCIMRVGPDDEVDREDDESERNPQWAKLAIAQCKRNARKDKNGAEPEKSQRQARCFNAGNFLYTLPTSRVLLALPYVVKLFEAIIVVFLFGLGRLPKEHRGGVISLHVQSVGKKQSISCETPVVIAHEGDRQKK